MNTNEQKLLQEISEKALPRVIEKLTQFLTIPESCLITFHIGGKEDQVNEVVTNGGVFDKTQLRRFINLKNER